MSNEQTTYTVETSQGNKTFTTSRLHTMFNKIEDFLKAHENTIGLGVTIYNVYVTHRGAKQKLK